MKIIPKFYHGVLDYLSGALLLLAPNLFGFADLGGAAVWLPRVCEIKEAGEETRSVSGAGS